MAAHALSDLAFQAASRGYPADAVPLGEAARVAATTSAGVRASVQTRLAIELRPVDSFDEVAREWPIVVNCSGLGSRALVPDRELHPIRGQHVLVTNPGLTEFLEVDTGDCPDLIAIYPHADHVILGGTAEPGRWNHEPDLAISDAIVARCTAVEPRLADARRIDDRVGLRPTPPEIRVTVEHLPAGTVLAHNYGHGGAGVSVSWGCATEIHTRLDETSTV